MSEVVAEKAAPPVPAGGGGIANNSQQLEFIIMEARLNSPLRVVRRLEPLYGVGSGFLCVDCIGFAVTIACDIWPADVSYTAAFERFLIY